MLINELAETISLDGGWDFRAGSDSTWYSIQVPGCWEAQGYSKYYEGPATYRRVVCLPPSWRKKTIQLEFDAISYAATIFVNGIKVGEHLGLWTPFSVDVSRAAKPGQENILELVIYKPGERYPMRSSLAGFIPDVATTFGGIWQSARMRAFEIALGDLSLDADYATVKLWVRSHAVFTGPTTSFQWEINVCQSDREILSQRYPFHEDGILDVELAIPDFCLWNLEKPFLYSVKVVLLREGVPIAQVSRRTGFRRLSSDGSQLLFNGSPFMIRGILSWGWEPDRIAPYYSREQARAEIQRVRSLGFNTVKLCLFVPNQAYFDVADEEGMLLWQEWPMWLPQVTPNLRSRAPQEYQAMMQLTRSHPSVVLYSLGCELNRTVDGEFLQELDQVVRRSTTDILICDNSGSGESYGGLDFDYADFSDYHPYYDIHYFESLLDNWRRDWQISRPWIFGEFCDADTFRDLDKILQANDGQRPWWLTTDNPVTAWRKESKAMLKVQDLLAQANLPFTAQEMTSISFAQCQVTRKYTLEALRRRSGIGGYIVTGLRDTPISTSGIWDDFGQAKWPAEEFKQINGDTVLLLDVGRRRRWRFGGDRPDRIDPHNHWSGDAVTWHVICHTTGCDLPAGVEMDWNLTDSARNTIANGQAITSRAIHAGNPWEVGTISFALPEVNQASEYCLRVVVRKPGKPVTNQWPIWVYPPLQPLSPGIGIFDPTEILRDYGSWLDEIPRLKSTQECFAYNILFVTAWKPELEEYLRQGGKVLYLQQSNGPFPSRRCPFWREAVHLFYPHPVWEKYPQQGYTDMHFFGLATDVALLSQQFPEFLPGLGATRPILRRLDAREFWVSDYLVEAGLGKGLLLACSLRIQGGEGAQPFGWQRNIAGSSLLRAILDYLAV